MKARTILISLALLLLTSVAFGQTATRPAEATFKLNVPNLAPETRKNLVTTFEPGFSKKAGGDLFVAKFGADKFRYEYMGEWIEFEPLNHLPALSAVAAANELYHENYWLNTNLRFAVRDYGVKVDIILLSAEAPKEFEFKATSSRNWDATWIRPPTVSGAIKEWPDYEWIYPVDYETKSGVLTYVIPQIALDTLDFPLTIDPTFSIAADIDDTYAGITDAPADVNAYTGFAFIQFGRYALGGDNGNVWSYYRWDIDIPRASRVTASHVTFTARVSYAPAFNTFIRGLDQSGSPAWRETGASGGFHTDNYADGSALNAISIYATNVNWAVGAWTQDSPYDTPDLSTITQEMLDAFDYDPLNSEGQYVGIMIDDGDGGYIWPPQLRSGYSYTGGTTAELDVTYDPWGEIMVCGGYRLDDDGLKYYGY